MKTKLSLAAGLLVGIAASAALLALTAPGYLLLGRARRGVHVEPVTLG